MSQLENLTEDELREWAGTRLPQHMLPSAILAVPDLPLTPNGKLDRQALAHMNALPLSRRGEEHAPQTATEHTLHAIWLDLLSLQTISRDDNFFAIGGDSMLALRLITAARAASLHITVKDIFQHPTLAELATATQNHTAGNVPSVLNGEERGRLQNLDEGEAVLAARRIQCGVLLAAELHADIKGYQVVSAIRLGDLPGLSAKSAQSALLRLTRENLALRTSFDFRQSGHLMQVIHRDPVICLCYEDVSELTEEVQRKKINELVLQEQDRSFSGSDFPLWRVTILKVSGTAAHVILAHHHAILDGWSVAIFFDALKAILRHEPFPTAPDHVHEVAAALEGESIESAEATGFWSGRIADWQPIPIQPRTTTAETSPLIAVHREIDSELQATIRKTAAHWACSPKHIHLAAHLKAIAGLCDWQDYAASGVVLNARPEEPYADYALGIFLNAAPLSLHGVQRDWRVLAGAVAELEAGMQPYRWYPTSEMITKLGMHPLNSLFNYTDFSRTSMRAFLTNVSDSNISEIPLTVSVVDNGIIVEGFSQYFSKSDCEHLASRHLENLQAAVREEGVA